MKASHSQFEEPPTTDGDLSLNEDVDMDMEEAEDEPVKIKTRRKVKKTIPMGSNGRPKKRLVQSQTRIDDKGYMSKSKHFNIMCSTTEIRLFIVTEDVSAYETDNDDTPDTDGQNKSKTKAETKKSTKSESKEASSGRNGGTDNPKVKKSGSGKSGSQGSLMMFFGKQK